MLSKFALDKKGLITYEILPAFTVPTMAENEPIIIDSDSEEDTQSTEPYYESQESQPATTVFMKKFGCGVDLNEKVIPDPFKMIDLPPPTNSEKLDDLCDAVETNKIAVDNLVDYKGKRPIEVPILPPYDVNREINECFIPVLETQIIEQAKEWENEPPNFRKALRQSYCSSINEEYITKAKYQVLKQAHILLNSRSKSTDRRYYKGNIGILICEQCTRIIDIWPATHKIEIWVKYCPYCKRHKKGAELSKIIQKKADEERKHLGLEHHTTVYRLYYGGF